MPIPTIARLPTARVVIRPVTDGDLGALFEINGDDAVTEFLPYASWTSPEDGSAWLARVEALAAAGTGQQYVVERRADRKVIAAVILFRFDEASSRLEVGYVVGRAHWRQGYAREVLSALCRHVFEDLGIRRLEAEVNPANVASCALLAAVGFIHEGLARKRWVAKGAAYDTNLYGCLADEWLSRNEEARPHGAPRR